MTYKQALKFIHGSQKPDFFEKTRFPGLSKSICSSYRSQGSSSIRRKELSGWGLLVFQHTDSPQNFFILFVHFFQVRDKFISG